MDKYTATELAYKHGYENGYEDGKPMWIPVSERLPEKCETVLCLIPTKECWVATWNVVDDQMWSDGESWCSKAYVTHWMPLPEAPKEEPPKISKETMDALKKMGEKVHGGE